MSEYRRETAKNVRDLATLMAFDRVHPTHVANGDEERLAKANYPMSFTKGLEHCPSSGLIVDANHFRAFREAIDAGSVDGFTTSVPPSTVKVRKWEAPTAGSVYELQGPDAQSVTMAPAPTLGSRELAYEMAEVYELALVRDVSLSEFSDTSGNPALKASLERLNGIDYNLSGEDGRPRIHENAKVTGQMAFRGSSPGVEKGPYLSQFLLLGNRSVAGDRIPTDGIISYGALDVDQRVPVAIPRVDFMTEWDDWLAVQNGADPQTGKEAELFGESVCRRFITTPRDLATYVHYDALYEAYLNACLVLLGMKTPTDPGFDRLSGASPRFTTGVSSKKSATTRVSASQEREAGGFALWGGPHILTLVTEVATRALKAVRFQKFSTHCRLRPEALAGRIHKAVEIEAKAPSIGSAFTDLEKAIQDTVNAVRGCNASGTALLPMAFQEGSPMHPSYGAGHATVAGACVTMLKAFFDTSSALVKRGSDILFSRVQPGDTPVAFVPDDSGSTLIEVPVRSYLTLEGELNKLAANISIGRNMAGVHYYSDYYDSVRMGEEIALGILEEQALCYTQDPFVFSVPTFDGTVRHIGKR